MLMVWLCRDALPSLSIDQVGSSVFPFHAPNTEISLLKGSKVDRNVLARLYIE